MCVRVSASVRFIRDLLLVVLFVALLYVVVQRQAQAYLRATTIDELEGVNLADEGITLNQGSHISVRKTPHAVFVQILHGEVLLKAREPSLPPMVVRAGIAQIRDYDAEVCVDMGDGRTSIEVIAGEARVGKIEGDTQVVNEVTLKAGDHAEISGSTAFAWFRLAGRDPQTQQQCKWGI